MSMIPFNARDRAKAPFRSLERESERQYRNLVHTLPAAVYTCDTEGRILLYNRAAVALWGREPVVGQDLWCGSWKIYRPDGTALPLDQCPMAIALRERRAVRNEEIVIERPDGTRRHVLPHPEPIFSPAGEFLGAVNMLMDVTESKETERAAAHFAALVASSDDAIMSKTLKGIVTTWNKGAERLYGYTAEEMIGQPVRKLIPPERHDEEPVILERLARGETIDHYETVRRRKDGSLVDISLTVSPIKDSKGAIIGASKIARDISRLKRTEADLKRTNEALAESNKELESFSYSVSHDLRAPLRTIDAFLRIMEEDFGGQLEAEARRCLGIVRTAAVQAGRLIDDLLEFSRLGRIGMDLRPVEMAELAREVADELRLMEKERTIDLTIHDLPPCRGDGRLLKIVWTNLLGNAFKYTRRRAAARIEVGWLPDDHRSDASVYYVKDNGVGFNMKYAQKLFGVFQRLHTKEEFEGTGVGLAIVHRIVQRHGGRVWAEDKVDAGASFYVSLPNAPP
jgi:PAS domain S-box-containing protein